MKALRLLVLAACLLPAAARAQEVDLYRLVLGVDVPEPAAFAALGVAPPARLGSAPKPVSAALLLTHVDGRITHAVAVDVTPAWLLLGGRRSLAAYRSRSLAGRLGRVLTKTVLSLGVSRTDDDPATLTPAFGLRATLHDPHDPVLNSRLPEDAAAAGADLPTLLARARRAMRARSWDPQVSAGWGVALPAGGAARHTLWLAAQLTTGARFDVLGLAELEDAFDRGIAVGGLAVRRKGSRADLQVGAVYRDDTRALYPTVTLDARLGTRLGALVWIGPRRDLTSAGVLVRWFAATDTRTGT